MNGENILERFGQNVQRIRKERNISQEKLAELAGMHRTYIGMIERAEKWLKSHVYNNPLIKWETSEWGEIPADFGRK